MTLNEVKAFVNSPPQGFEKLAFEYRQAIAARMQANEKLNAARLAFQEATEAFIRAESYERGLFDAVRAVQSVPSQAVSTTAEVAQADQGETP